MKRKMSSILSKNTSGSGDLANRDVDFVVQETDSEMKIKICKVVCRTRNTHQRWKHPSRELLAKKSFDFGLNFLEDEDKQSMSSRDERPENSYLRELATNSNFTTASSAPIYNFYNCTFN